MGSGEEGEKGQLSRSDVPARSRGRTHLTGRRRNGGALLHTETRGPGRRVRDAVAAGGDEVRGGAHLGPERQRRLMAAHRRLHGELM